MIISFIIRYKRSIVFSALGALAGLMYYYFIGCSNGSCLISSNPYIAIPYGALLGYLTAGIFKKN